MAAGPKDHPRLITIHSHIDDGDGGDRDGHPRVQPGHEADGVPLARRDAGRHDVGRRRDERAVAAQAGAEGERPGEHLRLGFGAGEHLGVGFMTSAVMYSGAFRMLLYWMHSGRMPATPS